MALTYDPNSLAAQPVRQIPSSKRRGTAASDAPMRQAIHDANRAPMGLTPPTQQTRQDRIIAARMDGTFNTKRDTFNQANAGKLAMDEAGNINPITAAPAAAAPSPPTAPAPVNPVPPVNTVTPPTPKLPAGGSTPMMKPVGKIDGRPASLVLEGMKSAPTPQNPPAPQSPGVRPPVTRTAGGELVQPGTPMNPNARWQKPGAPVTPSVTPPVTRNASVTLPVTPKSVTPPVTPLSPQQEKQFTALGQAHQLSQASQGPMPRVSPPAATPKPRPPVQLAATPMSPGSQQFQRDFKNFRTGLAMPHPPGVPAVLPNPKSTSPQPFSAAALGTSKPRAVTPPPLAMLGR